MTTTLTRFRRGPAADPRADGELLRLFAAGRDEAAFAALVRRHGSLVWGVAVRHAADRHAAEDAFQATFFALAREANRLRTDAPLAGWLHTVAWRLAGRTRRRNAIPLGDAATAAVDPLAAMSARELLTSLDAEIDRLPDRYRLPIILCGLEELTRDEAAERLGWPVGSVKGRLERGRELLRRRMAKRGIDLPAVWLAAVGGSVPAVLLTSTPAAALDFAATGRGGAAAVLAAGLGRSTGRVLAAVLLSCAAVALGTGWALSTPPAADPQPPKPTAAAKPDPQDDADTVPVQVRLNGKPAAGVTVWAFQQQYATRDKPVPITAPVTSGPDGVARIPSELLAVRSMGLFARDDAGRVGGELDLDGRLFGGSKHVAVDLHETTTVAGRITGTDGRPLPGVKVTPQSFRSPSSTKSKSRGVLPLPWETEAAIRTTDGDGRFAMSGVPVGLLANLIVEADGYGQLRMAVRTDKPFTLPLEKAGAVRLTFRGADAAGTKGVVYALRRDPPNKGAESSYEPAADGTPRPLCYQTGVLDGSRAHTISNLPPGEYSFRPGSEGSAAVRVDESTFVVESGATAELTLGLTPLAKVTGRLIDAVTGKPVSDAEIHVHPAQNFVGVQFPYLKVKSGDDGGYVCYAPPGHNIVISLDRLPDDYLGPDREPREKLVPEAKLTAAGHTFPDLKLRRATTFTAAVVDSDGRPVPAVAYPGFIFRTFERSVRTGRDGVVRFKQLDPNDMIAVRVRRGDAVNVPRAVEIGTDGKQTITVSKANAGNIAGRVTDTSGKPIPGAAVSIFWSTRGVGKESETGMTVIFETVTADAEGRYRSSGLWPTDEYWVRATADGYSEVESPHLGWFESKPYTIDLKLVPANLVVAGRVVDLAGRPIAGARVFNSGDGEKPMETTTDATGAFTLRGYRPGPGFVFASMPGWRLAYAPADPGGEPVTLTLRTDAEPPAPLPEMKSYVAAVDALTKRTTDLMWANRDTLGGFARNLFEDMVLYDRATAKTWVAQKPEFAHRLKIAELNDTVVELAKTDPDEAVARLADRKGRDGYYAVLDLAKRLRQTHPKEALRVLEDVVQRARATDMPQRASRLAEAGFLAARCGNREAGKAIVTEAADLAAPLSDKERLGTGYYRGWAIAFLAPFDRDRTLKLLETVPDDGDYSRYLAQAIDHIAVFDPEAALPLLDKFRGGSSSRYDGQFFIAYRIAATDPDRAQAMVAGVKDQHLRTLGYIKLAEVIGRKDRRRAWRILDAALAEYRGVSPGADIWGHFGGQSTLLAVAAVTARELGHANAGGFVALALSLRPTTDVNARWRTEQNGQLALALSFADPASARRLLEAAIPADEFVTRVGSGSRDLLFAAAFVLPEKTYPAIEMRLAAFRSGQSGLTELVDGLTAKNKLENVSVWATLPRPNTEWEE